MVPRTQAGRHEMAAGVAHLVGLLHRQDAGRVRAVFELRPHELGAARFDDEVRAGAAAASAGVASAGPRAAGGPSRQRCARARRWPSPSTLGSSTCVAPTFSATSRRTLIGSMAMIVDAPAMRAPCTALRPSGPQPTTATIDPGATVASVPVRRRAEAGDADAAAAPCRGPRRSPW